VPLHATSSGKLLLSLLPKGQRERLLSQLRLRGYTENTIVEPDKLRAELASIRARGYAIDDEEIEIGLRCVAAPIRDHSGRVVAAISVAAPVQRMSKKQVQAAIPPVLAAAENISRRLGFIPSLASVVMAE
jgi:DNA-binding IclR family transcriptional regulator